MFRTLALFCFAAVLAVSAVIVQCEPDTGKIKATPEILALFDESFQSLAPAEPRQRAEGCFHLLGFGLLLEDKTPAKKVIENLLTFVPSIEQAEFRNQCYEGIAHVLCDLEEYPDAVGILNRIAQSADQYKRQQNLALKIIIGQENNKTLKPFDTSALLHQAIDGAIKANDRSSVALSRSFLGRELVRQGKKAEAAAAFAEAMGVAQKLDNIAERGHIIGIVLKGQVWYEQVAEALAALQTIADPEAKLLASHSLVEALIYHEKYDDAEKLLKTLPADQVRDSFFINLVIGREKTITDEKIGELASLISSEEQRKIFLQGVVMELLRESRDDAANQVAKRFADPSDARMALFLGELKRLVDKPSFTEAIQFIDNSEEDAELRLTFKRSVLVLQYNETPDDSVARQFSETYTNEDKIFITELTETAKQAVEIPDFDTQMDVLIEVFQEQTQFMDIAGRKQTLKLFSGQLDKETDPVRIIQYRLLLAQLQAASQEKSGVKENLGKLTQTLSGVRDLKELKNLVPEAQQEQAPAVAVEGKIRLDLPGVGGQPAVDESAIRDQLFRVYVMMANLLAKADAPVESKAAFEKAKELAKAESAAEQKAEKLLILAQHLAEEN